MLKKYGKNCKLMYMDTESFIYHIKCENLYGDLWWYIRADMKKGIDLKADMKKVIDLFDTSNYPVNNRFDIPLVNNKVVGKMKDECCGRVTTEVVAVRSKMYALRVEFEDY